MNNEMQRFDGSVISKGMKEDEVSQLNDKIVETSMFTYQILHWKY